MLSNLNLFKSDLKNYSKFDLLIMADYLHISKSTETDLDTIIDSIALIQSSKSNMSNMKLSDLPSELISQIVQDLDIDAIGKLCTTSSQYSWVCNYRGTWKYIFNKELADGPTINDFDYKQAIIEMYNIKDLEKKYLKAAKKGYLKLLIKLDSQIDKKIQKIAILLAAKNGHLEIVKYLFKKDLNIDTKNNLLKLAAKNGHLDVVKYLIKNGANIHTINVLKTTKNGHLEIIKYLIENNVDININRIFEVAANNGRLEIIKYLGIEYAEIDVLLYEATKYGHLNVVKYLIENGANIHADNDKALRTAAENGHLDVVKYLIENGAYIHAETDKALYIAAENGHLNVVRYLIEKGADIHAEDDKALYIAAKNGYLDVVRYLIEKGAYIHSLNDEALLSAAQQGHLEIVKYLIENGADKQVLNKIWVPFEIKQYLHSILDIKYNLRDRTQKKKK